MGNVFSPTADASMSRRADAETSVQFMDPVLWKRVVETASIARSMIQDSKSLQECKSLLDGFSHLSEVINLRDMKGFTLLQHAIIGDRLDMTEYFLQKGADVNSPMCGRSLHLAAKLGKVDIVKLLLEYHADPDVQSCVCYPDIHFCSQMICVSQMDHMYLTCDGDVLDDQKRNSDKFGFPLAYAIQADNIECLKIFTKAQSSNETCIPNLHYACKLGSKKCVEYYVNNAKDNVMNQYDVTGNTPVMYALKWEKSLLELLVCYGAMLNIKTKKKQNLLHILLSNPSPYMYESLKYLLGCGLKMCINTVDSQGNSPLHVLLLALESNKKLIGRKLTDMVGSVSLQDQGVHFSPYVYRGVLQEDSLFRLSSLRSLVDGIEHFTAYEMQCIQCVDLLLMSGLNPNIVNRAGNTALHTVSRLNGSFGTFHFTQDYYIDMQFIYALMTCITKARGNVNVTNNSEQTILCQFIRSSVSQIFSYIENSRMLQIMSHQVKYFIACLRLLHKSGAQFTLDVGRNPNQVCFLHVVFGCLGDLHRTNNSVLSEMECGMDEIGVSSPQKILRMVKDITRCLLECGLDPNSCTSQPSRHLSLLYHYLLPSKPIVPITEIEDFIRLLLHYGVAIDQNGTHIMTCRQQRSTSYNAIPNLPLLDLLYVIGTRQLPQRQDDLFSLMQVLYNAMSESSAQECVKIYLYIDCGHDGPKCTDLKEYLEDLRFRPRRLKQICAKFAWSLCGRKMANIRQLPLPVVMQNYLGKFHY